MSKILFDKNGDLYRVTAFEAISQEDLGRELKDAQESVSDIQDAIEFSNKLQENEPAADDTTTVSEPTLPDVQASAPSQTIPVEPTAPTADPATATAPVAPIVLS